MSTPTLAELLDNPRVWRGREQAPRIRPGITLPTGISQWDQHLPDGGWPAASLIEILSPAPGCGEWRLLQPALRQLGRQQPAPRIMLIDPPLIPYPPGLRQLKIDPLILHTVQTSQDTLWAFEQSLKSGACVMTLCWSENCASPSTRSLRRLQLAAEKSRVRGFLFRESGVARQSSPAAMRLSLSPDGMAQIIKCRGMTGKLRAANSR